MITSLVLASLLSCSHNDPSTSDDPALGLDFVVDEGPAPITDDEVGADGLILDRLVVLLDDEVDETSFEEALASVDGSVASSLEGFAWLTITVPPMADLADAQRVADGLSAMRGIRRARPAWLATAPSSPGANDRGAPSGPAGTAQPALGLQRFFAAWNAAPLATNRVPVYVVDFYTENVAHTQIATQRFVGPSPRMKDVAIKRELAGNHGYWVASLVGAKADAITPTGTHAAPETSLDLVSVNLRGIGDPLDQVLELGRTLPLSEFFVLNTSFGFGAQESELDRAELALAWRELLVRRGAGFLHTTSGGNDGGDGVVTAMNSVFTLQATGDDLASLVPVSDREDITEAIADARARVGERIDHVQGQTLIVGASSESGVESVFSSRGSPVRMIGEKLLGVCVRADKDCHKENDGFLMTSRGTSGAAPQLAGLAAWLRAMDPTLDAAEIRGRLLDAWDGRWVDALSATLALESRGLPVRRTMLDYFPQRQGFDDDDIRALLAEIDTDTAERTWPRGDLNGDGFANRDGEAAFDLDGDGRLGIVTVTIPADAAPSEELRLDEASVSDLDILCWGAFAGPYTGDLDVRDEQLARHCLPLHGYSGSIHSVTTETCPHGERTTTVDVTVQIDEDGTLLAVSGNGVQVGHFGNISPDPACVLDESFSGPFVMEGDGSTSFNVPVKDVGTLHLVQLRSGTFTYSGGPNCGDPRTEPVEASITSLAYVRGEGGVYDFERDEEQGSDCVTSFVTTGVLR
ncbi:MAG: S8 family serine peptidase [Alphaproteobacteria bacterium]|nr:S8 family serine peptidase [Alphaproteobacteria bacterium]